MKADADDRGRRNDGDTADADEEVGWAANASRRKAAAFALLMDDAADDAEEPEVEHPLPKSDSAVNGKAEQKKKKKKKGAPELPSLDELELSVGDGKAESQHAASDNATKPPAAPASADLYATARPLKPSRQAEEDAEIEAILAEIDAEPQTSKKKSRKQKKKQKQAAASAAEGDEEAAVDESSAAVPAAPATEEETLPPAAEADAAPSPEGPEASTASEGSLTAAQKKRLKRKQKEAAKKAEGATAPSKDTGAGSAARAALVKRLQAQQQQRQEEELRRQRAEEEQRQREEEERRRAEEEQRRREEEREQRKEARRARREQLRREGKLLNRTERQRRARDELFRQQALAEGAVSAASMNGQAPKPQRVVSEEKRRPQRGEIMEAVEKSAVSVAGEAPDAPPSWEADAALLETTKPDEAPARARPPDQSTTSGSDDDEEQGMQGSSDDDDEEEVGSVARPTLSASSAAALAGARRELAVRRRVQDEEAARRAASPAKLRSPIICIMGHVDTGKTKLLDKIRRTHVQEGEAGGITQQIGATYFPIEAVQQEAHKVDAGLEYRVPSLLIIDTPGHESFTNLRSRGSSLCDIAILVIDIMHGLEPQTLESIELLRMRKTPFIVALNKIDRLYGWQACPMAPARAALEANRAVAAEFEQRLMETKVALAEVGFNAELYWENRDMRRNLSLVPTSAITGEGVPDLLMLLVQLPQKLLTERLMFVDFPACTALEVKVVEGLGTTVDVILTGGSLREGDTIVLCGMDGPLVSTVRALLTPHPMKELRVKGQYLHHKRLEAAQGIKISAEGLEKTIAGTPVLVARNEDEIDYLKEEVMADWNKARALIDKSGVGVYVQASTLGSLEALLEFLRKDAKIPVSGINIGPVHKRDVMRASVMLEHKPEYAVILAFDVKVEREAREVADELDVQIFTADIIYHLFDRFKAYMEEVRERRRREAETDVIFPVCASIVPNFVFNKKDPIIVGVHIDDGILRCGTPLVAVGADGAMVDIGRVISIEANKKAVPMARKGENVAVKIGSRQTTHIMYGRHFDHDCKLYSRMTRRAIDLLKDNYRDELNKDDWRLVLKLKQMFQVT
ncbi:hypothetical protein CDCA_CDCA03G0958 [Cyanidium caldarium]|uniref:Eukaryotic translation initiation factor 5B n=1 Tax=Cyanidium caldarium TaxID=2771 RepID=A0AAV9ISS4_CYACA|nr:hypothetical protein CDCA_CDCA03G0958 [Cyanidium caldarium]